MYYFFKSEIVSLYKEVDLNAQWKFPARELEGGLEIETIRRKLPAASTTMHQKTLQRNKTFSIFNLQNVFRRILSVKWRRQF